MIDVNDTEGDRITLNSSLGDGGEEDDLTGAVAGETPFWKTSIVAVITVLIIVILIIRFSLLLRSDKKEKPVNNKTKKTEEKKK